MRISDWSSDVCSSALVYEANVTHGDDGKRLVEVKMTLTAPGCGMGEILVDDVRSKLEMIPTVAEADVELVFDPPWSRNMMSEPAKPETGMLESQIGRTSCRDEVEKVG